MPFVAAQFSLPSVSAGSAATPGRCPLVRRRGVQYARPRPAQVINIRRAAPRLKVVMSPAPGRSANPTLGGFWGSLWKGIAGAAQGFVTAGPAGAVVGGAGGAIAGSTGGKGKGAPQPQSVPVQPQESQGPLANVSTGVLVTGVLAFSALILTLARGGGR